MSVLRSQNGLTFPIMFNIAELAVFWELSAESIYENAETLDLTILRAMPGGEDPRLDPVEVTVSHTPGESWLRKGGRNHLTLRSLQA